MKTFAEYQQAVRRTMKTRVKPQYALLDYLLGLGGEAGELLNAVKKMLFHEHDWDDAKVREELGDIAWYLFAIANTLGYDMTKIAQENVEKLRLRYPDGYSHEASRNRTV